MPPHLGEVRGNIDNPLRTGKRFDSCVLLEKAMVGKPPLEQESIVLCRYTIQELKRFASRIGMPLLHTKMKKSDIIKAITIYYNTKYNSK